jgi:branched-chain amino acid aminotransferase
MIWTRGEVVPDEALCVSVLDRTFEHGLGLFETFRTWNGHATLLGRHRDRMCRSAGVLGLRLAPRDWPDESGVRRLLRASGLPAGSDGRLRVVLSGGIPLPEAEGSNPTLWMIAAPLPPPTAGLGGVRLLRSILADPEDPLARHKTLNYWRRRIEQERAARDRADETLCVTPGGLLCEGTRSNLFLVRHDGRLVTPETDGPLLDGIMRRVVIERARKAGIEVVEGPVGLNAIASASEAFLTNSVRGMLPVAHLLDRSYSLPGAVTQRLWGAILPWLESGGKVP